MRIAMLTNNYKPIVGGVPVSIERLSDGLRKRGHQVTIFAPHFDGEEAEEGVVRFRSIKLPSGHGMAMPDPTDKTIAQIFAVMDFDLVHVHHPMLIGRIGLQMAKKFHIPIALTYHTRYECYLHYFKPYAMAQEIYGKEVDWIQKFVAAYIRRFMENCDLVFAPTPLIGGYLCGQRLTMPVKILPTGLGEDSFTWDEALTHHIKTEYGQGKKYLFCSVSRLAKEKNISFLWKVLAQFKQIHGDCFTMFMMGDGPYREKLEHEAQAWGLGDNIIFTGNIPHTELSSYYRACDLFLFASQSETQGLVLLEAMGASLPVVAVEASGVCDIVKNGENGYMTPMEENAFIEAMNSSILDKDGYAGLCDGAYATALNCTEDYMAANAENAYLHVIRET